MTALFSYSDVTTVKSSAGVYISYTSVYMDYIRTRPWALHVYNPCAPQCCGITNTYTHQMAKQVYTV